jgi:hypothetical protein
VLWHWPQAPWQLGKSDQDDQGLSGPDPREQLVNAQIAQSAQEPEHREHPDHAKNL